MTSPRYAYELPPSAPICYKPSMRKWMQDKLKRRKKTPQETAAEPAPLQPAYFIPEGETPTPPKEQVAPEPEPGYESEPAPASHADLASEAAESGNTVQPNSGAGRPRR